jgi:hypothetical protein
LATGLVKPVVNLISLAATLLPSFGFVLINPALIDRSINESNVDLPLFSLKAAIYLT